MTTPLRLLVMLPLLAVVACGAETAADDDQLGSAPHAPDTLVLQVRQVGGFGLVGSDFRSVPSVSVYADGRVVLPGPQIAVFPGPVLPSVQVGQLDAEQVQRLVDAGHDVVEADESYGQPPVADVPTTVVVVGAGEQREVASAVALSPEGPGADFGLTREQREAREQLSAYVQQVQEAAGSVETQPYEPDALAVLALPYTDAAGDGGVPEERAWPGPPLAEGTAVGAGRCVVADEVEAVQEVAAQATQATPWTSGGQRWSLVLRPLLPSESTCEDVLAPPAPARP